MGPVIPSLPPSQRFENPPGHQGKVDFAQFRLPWGQRHALIVLIGYSRLMWLQCYERQTMGVILEDGRETRVRLVENKEKIERDACRMPADWSDLPTFSVRRHRILPSGKTCRSCSPG